MRSLSLVQAVARHEQLPLPLRPATLHPAYVATDAVRDPLLQPAYLCFEAQGECWMHGLHLSEVADTGLRDASSPYGYGGPVSTSDDPAFLAAAWAAYTGWMRAHRVVVEYVRFHPVLGNHRHYGGRVADNREVVWVDLQDGDFTAGFAPRLRHALRKSAAAGLVYREDAFAGQAAEFAAFHRAAMRAMNADPFYHFDDAYFEQLAATSLARLGVCRQRDDDRSPWLAAGLFLEGPGVAEYHLAASCEEGRRLGASGFALHAAAQLARGRGLRRLYLGGGSDTRADNPLLFFKAAFSGQRLTYRTGATVFDASAYEVLQRRFPQQWQAHPERPIFYRKV